MNLLSQSSQNMKLFPEKQTLAGMNNLNTVFWKSRKRLKFVSGIQFSSLEETSLIVKSSNLFAHKDNRRNVKK